MRRLAGKLIPLLLVGILAGAALLAGIWGTQLKSAAPADGVIQWTGNGSDNLPCKSGGHWVLAPSFGITSATLTVNGVNYPMAENGNGSWSADSSGAIDQNSTASVSYTGPGDERNHLQLSHCVGGQDTSTPTETGTTPPQSTGTSTLTQPPASITPQIVPSKTPEPSKTPPASKTPEPSATVATATVPPASVTAPPGSPTTSFDLTYVCGQNGDLLVSFHMGEKIVLHLNGQNYLTSGVVELPQGQYHWTIDIPAGYTFISPAWQGDIDSAQCVATPAPSPTGSPVPDNTSTPGPANPPPPSGGGLPLGPWLFGLFAVALACVSLVAIWRRKFATKQ